jgi:hypothetical protein
MTRLYSRVWKPRNLFFSFSIMPTKSIFSHGRRLLAAHTAAATSLSLAHTTTTSLLLTRPLPPPQPATSPSSWPPLPGRHSSTTTTSRPPEGCRPTTTTRPALPSHPSAVARPPLPDCHRMATTTSRVAALDPALRPLLPADLDAAASSDEVSILSNFIVGIRNLNVEMNCFDLHVTRKFI